MARTKRHGRRGAGGKFTRTGESTSAGASTGNSAENAGEAETGGAGETAGADTGSTGAAPAVGHGAGHGITVEVPRAEITAELDAITSEAAAIEPPPVNGAAPAEVIAPPAIPPSQQAAELAPLVSRALHEVALTFAPNWEVTKAETDRVGGALAEVLAYWMPQQQTVDPKYVALFSLGMAAWSVVGARRDENGFRPLRAPPPARVQTPPAAPVRGTMTL